MKFEQYAQDGRRFLHEVAAELGDPENPDHAERVLTAVLHTLREILSPEESLHMISQLPMMIKAIYVNGWHFRTKKRIRSKDEFFECLMLQNPRTAPADFGDNGKAREKTQAVFRVLRRHISQGEIDDIVSQFPAELAELWIAEQAGV